MLDLDFDIFLASGDTCNNNTYKSRTKQNFAAKKSLKQRFSKQAKVLDICLTLKRDLKQLYQIFVAQLQTY